jgi:Beta-lactamase
LFEPGHTFNYEHSEHVVLGEILRRISGRTARDLVNEILLEPLNVATGRAVSDKKASNIFVADHVYSATTRGNMAVAMPPFSRFWDASLPDWTINLPDVARISAALYGDSATRLAPGILDHLCTPVVELPKAMSSRGRAERVPRSFGIGCAQYGNGEIGHNGSMTGQTCGVRINPTMGVSVVVGVNAWSPAARDAILERVMSLAIGQAICRNLSHWKRFLAALNSTPSSAPITVAILGNLLFPKTRTEDCIWMLDRLAIAGAHSISDVQAQVMLLTVFHPSPSVSSALTMMKDRVLYWEYTATER